MKATKLTISNIGPIADACVEISKPLLIFYGEVMQGKSTLLNALKWVMGGAFPDDIIRHGASEAHIQFEAVDDGKPVVIRREWYRAKDQTTKARAIQMTRGGVPVKKPTDDIARFLNPFLFNQDHLRDMSELERRRFMVELFGVDTTAEDQAITKAAQEAQELRAKVKGYGDINLTPVAVVDTAALRAEYVQRKADHANRVQEAHGEMTRLLSEHSQNVSAVDKSNEAVREHNRQRDNRMACVESCTRNITEISAEITRLLNERAIHERDLAVADEWLKANPAKVIQDRPVIPDTSAIQARINATCDTSEIEATLSEAGAVNERAKQYEANKTRAAAKAADEQAVLDLERQQRDLKADKVAKLVAISGKCGVESLMFSEDGSFTFEGTSGGMLSDSQLMRLSHQLSALYPQGFGLSLIDRGESLGKSVLELWKDAQARERSILVTVVGDKPASIPEHVGAFVVDHGTVTPQ